MEMLLVQLFSRPQERVARRTRMELGVNLKLSPFSKERIKLERVIRPIAVQSFPETFSLKKRRAIREVATISKLPNRDALDAGPFLIPKSRKMGAKISSTTIPMT